MPRSLKKHSAPAKPVPVVKNRNAAIRNDRRHQAEEAVPDARDVFANNPSIASQRRADHSTPPATTTALDISRAPERGQALELAAQLNAIRVYTKEDYQTAKELYGVGKQVKRKITEHWQRVTRSIDALKQTIFGFRDDDLQALEAGLVWAERIILDFESAENERVRRTEAAQREERERKAREERNRELEAAEDKALENEQLSADLSARELWFVTKVAEQGLNVNAPSKLELQAMQRIVDQAGYKDVDTQVARLLRTSKILDAIQGLRDAAAIREQAAARRQQPINIIDAPPVESAITRGRGLPPTKTYYSCEVEDANKLREAFLNGELPAEALIPNEVYLNAQARAAKSAEIFERAFPGCRLKTRQSI